MFGWRKRDDGFEWHKYVRTTIKLRRDARREKAERIKNQAAEGVKAAGVAAAQGVKVAGSAAAEGVKAAGAAAAEGVKVAGVAAGAAAREGARNLGEGSRLAASGLGQGLRVALSGAGAGLRRAGARMAALGRRTVTLAGPLLDMLARPGVNRALLVTGGVLFAAGATRAVVLKDFERDARIAVVSGAALLLAALLPRLLIGARLALPAAVEALLPSRRPGLGGLLIAALAVAGAAAFWKGDGSLSNMVGLPALPFSASKIVEGRAMATGPDALRIGTTVIRLAELEAPERDQVCTRPPNRRWRCGDAAAAALGKLVNGRALKCEVRGTDPQGRSLGHCADGAADVGGALVKGGHAFASGMLSRHSSPEAEARQAKAGVWGGTVERPAEWRQRVWEEARQRAPSGCPIKGQVTGNARTYVLPWSASYERVRVNASRGGRWFCSEQEAIDAGWTIASR